MELFGPWEDGDEVRAAIVEAGREFGLRQVGSQGLRDQHASNRDGSRRRFRRSSPARR